MHPKDRAKAATDSMDVVPASHFDCSKRLRMDLVDGHVGVLLVIVAMAHRDVLVLRKPQCTHKPLHDVQELLPVPL